jgi:hypothetical protein
MEMLGRPFDMTPRILFPQGLAQIEWAEGEKDDDAG